MVEKILWKALRTDPRQKEVKFRYQHPLSRFVADFACMSAKLIVEIDGASHDVTVKEDAERQAYIEAQGFMVLRFSNQDVLSDVQAVAEQMRQVAQERLDVLWTRPRPESAEALSTLPQGEGGGSCPILGKTNKICYVLKRMGT